MTSDTQLQHAVQAELEWDPSVNAAHIGVSAKGGVVTLTGTVATFAEKHAAEQAATRVRGVQAVAEEIVVRLAVETSRRDEDIALAASERLAWDVVLPDNAVVVTVEHGWVTLTGTVDWHYQKEAAAQDIRRLAGVRGVTNNVTIRPRVNASDISDGIMHALHRSWFFDPADISVTAHGGKVVLSGRVPSQHDRQVAAATAWAAPGVTDVDNKITVADMRALSAA